MGLATTWEIERFHHPLPIALATVAAMGLHLLLVTWLLTPAAPEAAVSAPLLQHYRVSLLPPSQPAAPAPVSRKVDPATNARKKPIPVVKPAVVSRVGSKPDSVEPPPAPTSLPEPVKTDAEITAEADPDKGIIEPVARDPLDVPPQRTVAAPSSVFVPADAKAAYLNNPKPRYPAVARRLGVEGVVVLWVELDENGDPLRVSIKRSSGFKPLDIAALQTVQRWRFVAAQRDGQAVASQFEVPVRFTLAAER